MKRIRITGVPEHFNCPWTRAASDKLFEAAGVEVKWSNTPGGTGAMVSQVLDNQVDVAVALTEGIISAILSNEAASMKYCGCFVASSLRWAVVTGASRSDIRSFADLRERAQQPSGCIRVSVSRLGSGSHLMAYLLAQKEGWPLDRLTFVVNKELRSMRGAVQNADAGASGTRQAEADIFMWEWFMTKPYMDSGELKAIGHLDSPWPCFGLLAKQSWLEQPGHREALRTVFRVVTASARQFVNDENQSCEIIAAQFGLTLDDAHAWLRGVRYSSSLSASLPALQQVVSMLVSSGMLPRGQQEGKDAVHGYSLHSFLDEAVERVIPLDADPAAIFQDAIAVQAAHTPGKEGEQLEGGDDGLRALGRTSRSIAPVDNRTNEIYGPITPEYTSIGAAHFLASRAAAKNAQDGARPPTLAASAAAAATATPPVKTAVKVHPGGDALPIEDPEAYVAWRQAKADALSDVLRHLASYGGADISGVPVAAAPAIPAADVHSVQSELARAFQDVRGVRKTPMSLHGMRDSVLVDIG